MLPYTLYQQLYTCIHIFTHTKVDWSIWSWWGVGCFHTRFPATVLVDMQS